MKANIHLGNLFGVKIIVHWTFYLLLIWVALSELLSGSSTTSVLFNIAFVLAVFACVVFHELGHAFTAKRFGIKTKKILLLPIGGMASFERVPESPKQEMLVVLAGPFVNIVIALILFFIIPIGDMFNLRFQETIETLNDFSFQNFLFFLFIVNVGLVVFNMIPAFPMDGGRILRALLAMQIGRVKATQIAASIGQFIAIVLLLIGLMDNPLLIFIALFIFVGAFGENQMVLQQSIIKGHSVEEAMLLNITVFEPEDSLEVVVDKIISGTETNFIVAKNKEIQGILFHKDIINNSNKNLLVKDVMSKSFKIIKSTDDLSKVYPLITQSKQSFFPVVNNGVLVGALDRTNLTEYILLESKLVY
ncbi:site-2 protease family protein [Aegicerativicinus sediminis]|uniref:site-2 protease family protein n=1 Tax=Aegicerativicinus sediminis TaxID=2893202 RepID=UPI001E31EBFA|nr:site-2 protease family protein [Aegicerativicinus sediminis]